MVINRAATALAAMLLATGCGGGAPAPVNEAPPADTTSPRITSIAGADNGSILAGSVELSATATDDTAVAAMRLDANGVTLAESAGGVLAHDWDTTGGEPGAYVVTVTAEDQAGNEDQDAILVYVIEYEGVDRNEPGEVLEPDPPAQPAVEPDEPAPAEQDRADVPALILSGISSGSLVYGTTYFTAFGVTESGIASITLVIDGHVEEVCTGSCMNFYWNTEKYEDGEHRLVFLVADIAGQTGEFTLDVEVDNTNDFSAPELIISNSTWRAGELSGKVVNRDSASYYYGLGEMVLVAEALDKSELVYFRVWLNDELRSETQDGVFSLAVTDELWAEHPYMKVELEAQDALGHSGQRVYYLARCTGTSVAGCAADPAFHRQPEFEVLLLDGAYPDPASCPTAEAIDSTTTDEHGYFRFNDLPLRVCTVYVRLSGTHSCVVFSPQPGYMYLAPSRFSFQPFD